MEAKGARLVFLGPCDFCSLCQYFFALVQFNILPKTNKITKVTKFLLFTITLLSPLKSICRRNQPSSIKMQTLDYFRQLTCACLLFNEPCAREIFFFFDILESLFELWCRLLQAANLPILGFQGISCFCQKQKLKFHVNVP